MRNKLWAVPLGHPFIPALTHYILESMARDPLQGAHTVVLLPTRRGCLMLQKALTDQARKSGQSVIFPKIYALADCEEGIVLPGYQDPAPLPEAISPWHALGILTRLVQAFETHKQGKSVHPAYATSMARELLRFVEEVETSGLSLAELSTVVDGDFAAHWQLTLDFLQIITAHWPALLEERQETDPSVRKRENILRLAAHWKPSYPVILAGTTGTRPATVALAQAILAMPMGTVILPGYDFQSANASKLSGISVETTNPQYALQEFVRQLSLLEDISPQPLFYPLDTRESQAIHQIASVLSLSMSTPSLDGWQLSQQEAATFCQKVQAVECSSSLHEAKTIALMMRETLEDPTKTVALVTPDPQLGRLVTAELQRWGIVPNNSAGQPFLRTVVGSFWIQSAKLLGRCTATEFLSLLKHPLCQKSENRFEHLREVRRWEMDWLRGRKVPFQLKDVLEEGAGLTGSLEGINEIIFPLQELSSDIRPLRFYLEMHRRLMENLCGKGEVLWTQEDGRKGLELMEILLETADSFPPLPPHHYASFLQALVSLETVRDVQGIGSRAMILGTLEARLIHTDTVILGGLNEGTWPSQPKSDAWLNRPMRHAFGLPPIDRKIAISAHEFCLCFSAPRVFMTRSTKSGGAPTLPSRWWQRLDAALSTAGYGLRAGYPWAQWALGLDTPKTRKHLTVPSPCPPLSARPKTLSVTSVETLRRDPYGFYARYILRLYPLEPLDDSWTAADRGEAIHKALERFIKSEKSPKDLDSLEVLYEYGERAFGASLQDPHSRAFWWPRFQRIAKWFLQTLPDDARHYAEVKGSMTIGDYTLTAQADRIDVYPGNIVSLIDYKTGALPSIIDIKEGFSPQLPLEGAMMLQGGFQMNSDAGDPAIILIHQHLTGGTPPAEERTLAQSCALVEAVLPSLDTLLQSYADPKTPFLPCPTPDKAPRYNDYLHLERQKEWELSADSTGTSD